jgi:hypothetical protein
VSWLHILAGMPFWLDDFEDHVIYPQSLRTNIGWLAWRYPKPEVLGFSCSGLSKPIHLYIHQHCANTSLYSASCAVFDAVRH